MKPIIVIILLVSFFQNYAQSSHNINVKIDQKETCETLSLESNQSHTFKIYPNPANTRLNVKSPTIINELIVYNAIGHEVLKYFVFKRFTTIDVSHLQNSIYFLQIKTDSEMSNHKIIIGHD